MTARPEILVAGGGLAGAAAALALAQAGREVVLLEREAAAKDKVCGEFLSGEGAAALARLGLDVMALGGQAIGHIRLLRGRRAVRAALPFRAVGLSRLVLDEAVLALAAGQGAEIRRGCAVRRIDAGIVESPAENFAPGTLLLATGKHETRGLERPAPPGTLVGFKTHFRLAPAAHAALSAHVELVLFPGGYAGLLPVEGGRANFSLVIEVHICGAWAAGRRFSPMCRTVARIWPRGSAAPCHCAPPRCPSRACLTVSCTARHRRTLRTATGWATRRR